MSCESIKFRSLLYILLGLSTFSIPVVSARSGCDTCTISSRSNDCNGCNDGRSGCNSGECGANVSGGCSTSCSNNSGCSASCSSGEHCNDCDTRTFWEPVQVTFDPTYELGLNNYFHYYNNAPCRPFVYLHAVPFYQKSRRGRDLARFFFPTRDCSNSLVVEEEATPIPGADINSLWLGLVTARGQAPFKSTISICPERKTFGAVLYAYFDLCSFMDGLWASFNFTPMRAEHRLNFREKLESPKGVVPGRQTVTDILTSRKFVKFGRFYTGKRSRTGVDDIQGKFGWNFWDTDCGHAGIYSVVGLPTGRKINDQFIFEPIVGTRNFKAGFGVNADYMLWQWCNSNMNIMVDFKYLYAFRHDERRSFDFCCNGEFSRFLPLVTFANSCPQDNAAAINFFSPCVRVEPRSQINFWTAVHYEWCGWNLEFGYRLFWRDAEKISFINRCNNRKDLGIFDLGGICGGQLTTASHATIAQAFNKVKSDAVFTNVDQSDLNPCSAAQPRILTNRVYGAGSYNGLWCDTPYMLGLLGSYEFARHHNSRGALEQWAVAVNLSVGF